MRSRSQSRLFGSLIRDIGIDLGTANSLVFVAGQGIVIHEPSVIAVSQDDRRTISVGEAARHMLGRTPQNIEAIKPIRNGVIADYLQTEELLRSFIQRVTNRFLLRKNVLVGVPSGVTEVERRAVLEATRNAGATHSFVIEEPIAAAFGSGLPVHEPTASIVVDVGGGTTEVAIISSSGIVHANSLRIAGDELDEAIISYVRRAYNLLIGEQTAERAKVEVGCVVPLQQELRTEIRGRDLVSGLPKSVIITSDEIRNAILEPVNAIVQSVKITLEAAPPELAGDAIDRGILLCGGGALLRGFEQYLAEHTMMKVQVATDPLLAVAHGTGRIVAEMHHNVRVRRLVERASLY
jgi:rod shape-determining protein MreB